MKGIGQSHTAWGCCGVSQLKSALLLAHLNFSGFVSLKLLAQRLHHHEEHRRQQRAYKRRENHAAEYRKAQ